MRSDHLLAPICIRGKFYKNRILAAPTGFAHMLLTPIAGGTISMLEDRAEGGQASICVGEHMVSYPHETADAGSRNMKMPYFKMKDTGSHDFEVLKDTADRIKKHGALAFMELAHPGSDGTPSEEYPIIYGPMELDREDGVHVCQADEAAMLKIAEQFASSALFCKMAGFDGVLIHGGHGFLFTQFFSPLSNQRTDAYGGSVKNRMRFPLMILRAVRERVGEDFLIELRISGSERMEGGVTPEMMGEFVSELSGLVDILHVSSGHYFHSLRTREFSSVYHPHGCNLDLIKVIRPYVPDDVYLGVVGGFNSPEMGEEVIASGLADFIILGRQMFADPYFAKKTADGRADDIQRCLRCMRCYKGSAEHPIELAWIKKHGVKPPVMDPDGCYCSVNPASRGFFAPSQNEIPPAQEKKRILIVGGGAAGLEAAAVCARRGFDVILAEKSGRLGGVLWFADQDVYKEDLRNFRDLLIRRVMESDVDVRLNCEVTQETIKDFHADVVLLAIGAKFNVFPIPGIETAHPALDAYDPHMEIGERVILLGGGLVGCDTAVELASRGCDVTVVEMQQRLAPEAEYMQFTALMDKMEQLKIKSLTGKRCISIRPEAVTVQDTENDAEEELCADTVLYCLGMSPLLEEAQALTRAAGEKTTLYMLGDCDHAARVGDAVRSAYRTALAL